MLQPTLCDRIAPAFLHTHLVRGGSVMLQPTVLAAYDRVFA